MWSRPFCTREVLYIYVLPSLFLRCSGAVFSTVLVRFFKVSEAYRAVLLLFYLAWSSHRQISLESSYVFVSLPYLEAVYVHLIIYLNQTLKGLCDRRDGWWQIQTTPMGLGSLTLCSPHPQQSSLDTDCIQGAPSSSHYTLIYSLI